MAARTEESLAARVALQGVEARAAMKVADSVELEEAVMEVVKAVTKVGRAVAVEAARVEARGRRMTRRLASRAGCS